MTIEGNSLTFYLCFYINAYLKVMWNIKYHKHYDHRVTKHLNEDIYIGLHTNLFPEKTTKKCIYCEIDHSRL